MCRLTYTKRYTFLNGNRKENEMDEFKFNVETTVIGTADGKETFEVRKQYNVEGNIVRNLIRLRIMRI